MADNKNMELNDEMMAKATGGEGEAERWARIGVVREHYEDPYNDKWIVDVESGGEIIARYGAIGVEVVGRKVRCELVALGMYDIVEFL
jgi:hypothetical protein